MVQEIWASALTAFGKEVYKAWPMICRKWEHALWLYNDEFGPLNVQQREYFIRIVVSSLQWAGKHPADQRYARFQASLNSKLNLEMIRVGFKERETIPEAVQFPTEMKKVPA